MSTCYLTNDASLADSWGPAEAPPTSPYMKDSPMLLQDPESKKSTESKEHEDRDEFVASLPSFFPSFPSFCSSSNDEYNSSIFSSFINEKELPSLSNENESFPQLLTFSPHISQK